MPSVMTPHGAIRYKTIPLFPGVKRIDKEIAFETYVFLNLYWMLTGLNFS